MDVIKLAITVGSVAALAACGGGGDVNQAPLTGVFIDAPVEGLAYATPTQSGITDANGYFKYLNGENVTFSLYGQELFGALGYSYLTPFDLGASKNPNYSINLVRFLIAVDADGNASNGIKLPPYSGSFDINFDRSIRDFEADADGKISAFLNSNAGGRQLASVQEAVTHFNNSISNISPNYALNFAGKTATSVILNSSCSNNVSAGFQISFGLASAQFVGSDGFTGEASGNCVVNPSSTQTINYADIVKGDFLDCLPTCDYKSLNKVSYVPSDADGRTAVQWSWHTPNTKLIYSVKTILADPVNNNNPSSLNTFVELIRIN